MGNVFWNGRFRHEDDDYVDDEPETNNKEDWKKDYFDAINDGQLGDYEDFNGDIDGLDNWLKG